MNVRALLMPLDGSPAIEIAKDMTLVGRKEDCDLRLEHKSISKIHCVLVKTDGLLLLRDLGSTNGTRVNGTRVRRAALLPNDKVSFANFHFKVQLGPMAPAAPLPDESTQFLDQAEVEKALAKDGPMEMKDSVVDAPLMHIQTNAHPDVYPEEGHKKKK